jgi:hypothetical protein
VDPDQAAEKIRDLWALPLRPPTPTDVLGALSRQPSPVVHPVAAVTAFIESLVQDGLLAYAKGDYSMPVHHRQALREGGKALATRERRAKEIAEKIDTILALADPDELAGFSRETWMQTAPPGFAKAPHTLIYEGGEDFERLDSVLDRLTPAPWRRSIPTASVGLPIDRHLEREAEMARAAEEAAEAAKKAEAEKARLNRLERINAYSVAALGWGGQDWLSTCPPGSTASLLAIAGANEEGYERVRRAVDKAAHDRRAAQEEAEAMSRRQGVLRRRAAAVLDETTAAFFLDNARNELARLTPLQACNSDRA